MNVKGKNKKNQVVVANIFEQQEIIVKAEEIKSQLMASTWHELETNGKFDKNDKLSFISDDMLILGCDIGSETHYIRAIDTRGRELSKSAFAFANDLEGFQSALDWATKHAAVNEKTQIVMGLEPTGHYWFCLATWMIANGVSVVQVNPYAVKQTKEIEDNSQLKDDRKDPKLIANLVKDGNFGMPYLPEGIYADMRRLTMFRDQLTEDRIRCLNRMHREMKICFPEYKDAFGKVDGAFCLEILKVAPFPEDLLAHGIKGIEQVWHNAKLRGRGYNRAMTIISYAESSVGLKDGADASKLAVKWFVERILELDEQLSDIEKQLNEKCKEIPYATNILEISGVGEHILSGILAEMGDISRFDDVKEVQKLAGMGLVACSSGKHEGKTKISHRGRKRLRYWLFQAAKSAVAHADEFKELHIYYTTRPDNPLKKMQSWCADFVSDCAKLAGLENIIPFDGYCETLYSKIKTAGGDDDISSPQKGDLVFYYCSVCSVHWCHVGIMLDSKRSIEGNYSGKVSSVNGVYRDSNGHSLASGTITRKFIRPAYGGSINDCDCNESYQGYYLVKTNSLPLNLRSGHGTGYPVTGSIPKGELVYVSKGNGSWAHVEWNGHSGYCDMQYLQKIRILLDKWLSDTEMGNKISEYQKGKKYYFCYRIFEENTAKQINQVLNLNYQVTETIYKPDGSVASTNIYNNNDYNCISFTAETKGNYKAVIKFTINGTVETSIDFEVKSSDVEEIQISDQNNSPCSNILLKNIGDTVNLKAKITPQDADNKEVTWTSSDPTVASVDSSGKVTAKKDGVTKITVTAKDGGGASASCNVRVKTYGIVYGDCNDDGAVTATDLSVMNQAVNGALKLTEAQKQAFDLNGDGIVDIKDKELLNQFISKTRTSFPVEEQLSEVVINTLPTKTTYYVGDPISIRGVILIAHYNNGTTKTITSIDIEGDTETAGRKTVTLSYTEAGITKSASYQITVKEKEVIVTAAPVQPTVKPIVTINPTIVPSPVEPSATIVSTPSSVTVTTTPSPTQPAVKYPTAIPNYITTGSAVAGEFHPIPVPNITASPTIKPVGTTNPTKDTSNTQNNQKEDFEQYEEYEVEDETGTLDVGDTFEIRSVVYEVIDADEPAVELVAIEKSNIKSVSVPATVKYEGITYKVAGIGKSAFKNNKKITSLTIGNNVTYIGSYAFYKNTKLKKITIKSLKLEKVQKKAFWGLPKKVKIKLPTSKKVIYNNLLKNAGLGKR